jgi:predicted dehydrogenase/type 1 glutamine amidotransferase
MQRALLLSDQGQTQRAQRIQTLLAPLRATGECTVTAPASTESLSTLERDDVVIADVRADTLTEDEASDLEAFVWRGGALVALGGTGDAWGRHERLYELLGVRLSQRTPATELIARVAAEHDITRRLDPSFAVQDSCLLFDAAPRDAEVLLTTTWRYETVPLAFLRSHGAGCVFFTSLGLSESALDHPVMGQVLYRALRYVTGWREAPPIGVALVGYGAIGYEHGDAIRQTPGLEYAVVCDRSPTRLETARTAFPQVRTTEQLEEVARDASIGAVIIGTPPNTHATIAEQMLQAGKHVVVEKPFCLTTAEADRLIALAGDRHLALTVYQNRRWDPDFLAIQSVVRAGTIGEVFHIETFIGGFSHPCDLWHSHEPISGGVFYDWGSHYLDWVLTLVPGEVSDVRASAHKRVWHDVTNADQANLHIRFASGQEATFIHSDIAAILKPKWYILGTQGAIVGHWRHETVTTRKWSGDLIEERLAPAEVLPALTVATRTASGQIHEQRLSLPPAPPSPFHRNLANHLLAGEPLAVSPLAARRNIAVLEAAAYSAAHDAELVHLAADQD